MSDRGLGQSLTVSTELRVELAASVNPIVAKHWTERILGKIRPAKLIMQGGVDEVSYTQAMHKFAGFEAGFATHALENDWKIALTDPIADIHYFGIGTGEALELVTRIANRHRHRIIAYDSSDLAYDTAVEIFERLREEGLSDIQNEVYLADIEFVCKKKYIKDGNPTKMILPRVLNVLDKQDKNWKSRQKYNRKMARTLRAIGRLQMAVDLLIIHPENDPFALWGDTTPHSLEEIAWRIRQVFQGTVDLSLRGDHRFYNHVYSGASLQCRPVV